MADAWPRAEIDVAKLVVDYLSALGWEVYQEVRRSETGPRADIVGVRGRVLWVVEVKKTLGLDLLAQGHEWRGWANMVSLAFPGRKTQSRVRARHYAEHSARRDGMGLLEVRDPSKAGWHFASDEHPVRELDRPRFDRRPATWLRERLSEEHKTFAEAGNAEGKFWSPFKRTCGLLLDFVRENPGCTLRQAIAEIDHHYANPGSAAGSLRDLIDQGVVEGVKIHKLGPGGGPWRLYPAGFVLPEGAARPPGGQASLFGGQR